MDYIPGVPVVLVQMMQPVDSILVVNYYPGTDPARGLVQEVRPEMDPVEVGLAESKLVPLEKVGKEPEEQRGMASLELVVEVVVVRPQMGHTDSEN